jgi:hypothetical protein
MNPTLQQLEIEIMDALHGLDAVQTQASPAGPGKWNIQQIVQHLFLTYVSTMDAVESRLMKGTPTKAKPTVKQRFAQFTLFKIHVHPDGRKAPAWVIPPALEPLQSGNDLTCSAAELLSDMDRLFDDAEALFGSGPCITHFLLGPLTIEQWRKFHLLHGDHHVRQILAIRAGKNF